MNSALYIGATGMKALSQGMNVTANNLANVGTIGYKQQGILFSEMMSTEQGGMGNWWNAQEGSRVALGQTGMGVQVEAIRTIFTQGAMEASNTVTDMAINGKGFFQVNDNGNTFYTRAGDFRPDNQGVLRTPTGLGLMGYKMNADGSRGGLAEVTIDKFASIPPKSTSRVDLGMNLGMSETKSVDAVNPYFSLLGAYDGTAKPPLSSTGYGYSQPITVYDAAGTPQTVTAYFDKAPGAAPNSTVQYLIAGPPGENPQAGDGMLMSGTLTFNSSGQLTSMSAFSPTTAGSKNLADWVPSPLSDGLPQITLNGAPMTVNFGLSATGGWQNAPASAAAVGTDETLLSTMGPDAVRAADATTAVKGSSTTVVKRQDGYDKGTLNNINIRPDGTVEGRFSNSQTLSLWEIPICRFTSEDGLRREGGNLFSATPEAGQMEMGMAGTENYGKVAAYNIEMSNVDMASEMVSMIITQRGFQSNSKSVTTADQMLQKAMELKRT